MAGEDAFQYRDGELFCEEVPARRIAEQYSTPCYVYSARSFVTRYRRIRDAFAACDPLVCFSMKSCGNLSVLKLLAGAGSGFDVASGGELYKVLLAGADARKTVFAGVGKTSGEIEYALKQRIFMFNVESRAELACINDVASRLGERATVAIRVNPDVEPHTHEKIATGKAEAKFGIDIGQTEDLVADAADWAGTDIRGVHFHLGSLISSVEPYVAALAKIVGLIERLRSAGCNVDRLNIGGGFCVSYTGEEVTSAEEYAAAVQTYLEKSDCKVIIEPGRYIAGNSGLLLTRVIYRKETESGKRFAVCDAAMTDLIRPTLYGSFHRIWPVRSEAGLPEVVRPGKNPVGAASAEVVDVVGGVCETGDFLAKDRALPPLKEGELLAVFDAGAYGFAMSSNYNARPRAAEVLVEGGECRLVRRRETYEGLVRLEKEFL